MADKDDKKAAEGEAGGRQRLARDVAREIVRQVREGLAVMDRETRQPRPCGYGDFLILVRKRDALFEEIIRALKRERAPVARLAAGVGCRLELVISQTTL
jgi:ATP-dependent helicase/nuclease subunit A